MHWDPAAVNFTTKGDGLPESRRQVSRRHADKFAVNIGVWRGDGPRTLELEVDVDKRTARLEVPGLVSSKGEPIRNPVTWSQIATTPARNVDGMRAKIAFASIFNLDEREHLVEGTMEEILASAAMDYADLSGQEARP
jgi:hypothetical protein